MASAEEQPFGKRARKWIRQHLWWIAPALGVLYLLVWWLVPLLLYRYTGTDKAAKLKAITDTRTALLAGLIGVGALLTFWLNSRVYRITAQTLRVTEQGQITERYTKAIEQLGSDKEDVRLGGIYALERIANDSPSDRATIEEVLTAFVRGHSPSADPGEPSREDLGLPIRYSVHDVQAALTVLGRRKPPTSQPRPLDLSFTDLYRYRANLRDADLRGANLVGAQLQGADLTFAKLEGAYCSPYTEWPEGFDWERAGVELQKE